MAILDFVKLKVKEIIARGFVLSVGLFYAGVTLASLILKRIRHGSDIWVVKERSLPPLCLQDAAYGRHAFVRLKVSSSTNTVVLKLKGQGRFFCCRLNCFQCFSWLAMKFTIVYLQELKIHYVENGDRSKPLMLFVHGFPEFWFSWRHQLKYFSSSHW